MNWYRWDGVDLVLDLRAQPRAKQDAFAAPAGERLKVRLAAPPVDGKANAALITFLAEAFAVPRSAVKLEQGATHRDKRLRIHRPPGDPRGAGGCRPARADRLIRGRRLDRRAGWTMLV